jgi:hypothetical protein
VNASYVKETGCAALRQANPIRVVVLAQSPKNLPGVVEELRADSGDGLLKMCA